MRIRRHWLVGIAIANLLGAAVTIAWSVQTRTIVALPALMGAAAAIRLGLTRSANDSQWTIALLVVGAATALNAAYGLAGDRISLAWAGISVCSLVVFLGTARGPDPRDEVRA